MTLSTDFAELDSSRRLRFSWVVPALFAPRRFFDQLTHANRSLVATPLLLLIGTGLIRTLIAGYLKAQAAAMGQINLPPGFEYYTPEQQAQFQQAITATNNPMFHYLLPTVVTLALIFGAWLGVGFAIHLVLTLFGGRGSSTQALNIVAWAMLPFLVRDGVRVVYMLTQNQLLDVPGLSGFAPTGEGMVAILGVALLGLVDLYLFWFVGLLLMGFRRAGNVSAGKTWLAVIPTLFVLMLLRALPAILAAQFSDLTVIPFF